MIGSVIHRLAASRASGARTVGVCLVGLALVASQALAQGRPIRFAQLGLESGLSQATALVLHQDRRGFLWVGTEDGLNRYDGYRFQVYSHEENDSNSLPGDHIYAITESAEGDIWVGTDGGGVGRWSHETDRFTWYRRGADGGLSSDQVRALAVDATGAVWIGTRDAGLNRLDPTTGDVTVYRAGSGDAGLVSDNVFALAVDPTGALWVGSDGGLQSVTVPGTPSFRQIPIEDDRVRSILVDRAGDVWVGTQTGGLHLLQQAPLRHQRYGVGSGSTQGLPSATVRAIMQDDQGRIWIGTAAGLSMLNRETGAFSTYKHSESDPASLSDDYVMSLLQDRGGVMWVGTRSGGVNRWNPSSWRFGHVSSALDGKDLSHDNVTAFAVHRTGTLWVGTFGGGLNRFDRKAGIVTHSRATSHTPGTLSDDRVMSLLVDQRGRLWVGTFTGGLNRLDPGDTAFRTYRHDDADPNSLGADGVMVLHEDRRGNIWVGTFGGGLNRFDEPTGTFVHYSMGDDALVPSPRVTALADDVVGALWIGTDGAGVYRLEPDTNRVQHFRHDPASTASLPSDAISATYADPAGLVWFGTRGGGLVRLTWTPEGPVWKAYTKRHGLLNEVVYGIEPDKAGHLWLSTNNGLFRFDPANERFTMFNASHGLQASEFNFGAHYRAYDGELFFGGIKGFNAFLPEQIEPNRHAPPVVLTSFLKFNQPVALAKAPHALDAVDVGYRDSVITFEFAALDFASSANNRYRYRLEGFDDSWLELGAEHRVTFTNLDSGRYRLLVHAANNDGVWNEDGLALDIRVEAPPWQRWWAYAIYLGMLALMVTTGVRASRAKHRREVDYRMRLETEVQERTQELAVRNIELERLNGRLVDASLSDPMTGLRNRRFLFEHVVQEIDLLRRRLRERLLGQGGRVEEGTVFLIVDIDRFKHINDTLGHAAGDKVILEFVRRMQSVCRPTDVLFRWGGDEFLIIARDTTVDDACVLAEQLRQSIGGTPIEVGGGHAIPSSCSIGFAGFPFIPNAPQVGSWEETLAFADLALYAAKRGSRNAWAGCASTPETPARLDQLLRESPETLERAGFVQFARSIAFPTALQTPRAVGQ
jgi:diguanylate cyclase (GGDEF)-like protein